MRLTFTLHDVQKISGSAYRAFISTFLYPLEKSKSDIFGCGEITPDVESMVENSWEICNPLDDVYGTTTSKIIRETVTTATEEIQGVGLKLFGAIITPGEDWGLITTCTEIAFWCCCETIKKVSPVLAEATSNLMY